jgi:hypothetical protein
MEDIYNLFKYFVASILSRALPEVKIFSTLPLIIRINTLFLKRISSALKRAYTNLCRTQIQEGITASSLMATERKYFQDL